MGIERAIKAMSPSATARALTVTVVSLTGETLLEEEPIWALVSIICYRNVGETW
jgi:hypothetical protein